MAGTYGSMMLDAPIARGRTAELFAWQDGRVLKLFYPEWQSADAQREADKAQLAYAAGLPVTAVHGLVQINGRVGILYDRVAGLSLVQRFLQKPWQLIWLMRLLADLHRQMHQYQLPQLPRLPERLGRIIEQVEGLPEPIRRALLDKIAASPPATALCHGDFHPDNVLITASGPVILDWMDATSGDPLADVARTSLILHVGALPPDMPGRRLLELARGLLNAIYLRHYFRDRPFAVAEWNAWQAIVAAARLAEQIPGERERLMALIVAKSKAAGLIG